MPGRGPAVPTGPAIAAQRPLPAPGARLTGGLLHEWQRRNATVSMPLALRQLVAAGNLDNLRLAIGAAAPAAPASPAAIPPDSKAQAATVEALADASEPTASQDQPSSRRAPRASGVTPPADLGYRGPVFMDSDLYKTLEAIGWELESARRQQQADSQAPPPDQASLAAEPGPADDSQALASFAAATVGLLARVQRPDGYLNSYIQVSGDPRYGNLASSHEMYCGGHLLQAAVALGRSRAPGGELAMDIATRLADHLVKEFAGQRKGLDGHPVVETALIELYRATGTAAYRDLAAQFIEQRGHGLAGDSGFGSRYLQDHQPVRETTTEIGHAVRALYLEAGVTDVATETNDTDLLNTSIRRWADMAATKTALTGGNGSRHEGESFGDRFELPPDRAYNETCAAIASFQWSWRLLLATGEARYADHMERILFNGFASAISTAGDRFFYVNPLQRREDHYEKDDPGRRREWFKCACCPPNIMRLLASLHHYVATTKADTLTVHQYATATIAGAGLTVQVATDYPWDGEVTFRIAGAPVVERELALRIPAWTAAAGSLEVDVNGSPERVLVPPDRYLRLRRAWRPGDMLRLRLDMTPRWTYPDPRADALRGCVAIERGPLVYCFEQADQAARLDELVVFPGAPLTERAVTLPGVGSTIQLTAAGRHAALDPTAAAAPHPAVAEDERLAAVTAIPYFQWDNRGPGAMRVWIPVAGPANLV